MNAYVTLVAMTAATAAALLLPAPAALALALAAFLVMRKGRASLLALAGTSAAINTLLLGATLSGQPLPYAPFLSERGVLLGLEASLRLTAALGVNLALLTRVPPARLLEGLRLPPRATGTAAAVFLAAQDVARDHARLREARRLEGDWPEGRARRLLAAAALLPLALMLAHERAGIRRDALRLAGIPVGPRFVAVVTIAALAMAGRLAFLAFPNVALTYVVVFLGGLLFGPLAGALGGGLGMLLTDFALTGLYPAALVNVPAMMALGLLGGACKRVPFTGEARGDRLAGALFAATLGIGATLAFSVLTDSFTWLLVLRGAPDAWLPLVVAGLAFNVLPALANALVFGLSVAPTIAAFEARRARRARPARRATEAPARGSTPEAPAVRRA